MTRVNRHSARAHDHRLLPWRPRRRGIGSFLLWLALLVSPAHGQNVVTAGGVLTNDTSWAATDGEIHVLTDVSVPEGVRLTIGPGTAVKLTNNVAISADGGVIDIAGSATNRVRLTSLDGTSSWAGLLAHGTNATLSVRFADVSQGRVDIAGGARGLLEDCAIHDYVVAGVSIVHAMQPAALVMRRCHVARYYEILSQFAVSVVEDCLFEQITGDGIDLDAAQPGSVIRDCTFRFGAGTNIDAIDLGQYADGTPSHGVLVERCWIHDFPSDKGVSVGEAASDITVRDCVIYRVDVGIAVKDSSVAEIYHNTLVDAHDGLRLYEKIAGRGGGHAVAWDNVIWGNTNSVVTDALSSVVVTNSVVQGDPVYSGAGNINLDPTFRNPDQRDYRLQTGSPVIGLASDGTNPGARFPVGSMRVDSDGDGLPDPWELAYDLDFVDPADATLDPDGDGLSNFAEFQAGTDPRDPRSNLWLEIVRSAKDELSIAFTAVAGRRYRLEKSTELNAGPWLTITNFTPVSTTGRTVVPEVLFDHQPVTVYRLILSP